MAVESIPIYGVLRSLIRWLPAFLFKRHFTSQRLESLIYCDLQPRGEPVTINTGQVASAKLNLQIINLAPFPVEIIQAKLQLHCGGADITFIHLNRIVLEPGAIRHLFMQSEFADGAANAIANSTESPPRAWLTGHIELNCAVRNFAKSLGSLVDIYPTVVNANVRRKIA